MPPRHLLASSALLAALCSAPAAPAPAPAAAAPRPNVILLLLDDAGWADTGAFGGRMLTPHLDRLAAEGLRFTDCHSAAPNCSPSRAGLLTGRNPTRVGIYSYLPENHVMHLRDGEITVAELARGAGYRTGHFGKWHLSDLDNPAQPGPRQQGFEHSLATGNNAAPSHRDPVNFVRNGQPVGRLEGYSCQIVVDEALAWIERSGGGRTAPFLACVWFHEPHLPIASPPELVAAARQRLPGISEREATYLANVENVDRAVGRLLAHLERQGLARNTVIWFTSDNGPLDAASRGGLRGLKSHVWEGGHRVPGIVRWPARIAAGSVSRVPVSGLDFLPTFCALAGVPLPRDRKIDGVSLLPLWEGREGEFHRTTPLLWYFYRLNPSIAMREGDWALVAQTDDAMRPKAHQLLREDVTRLRASRPERFALYNLANDLAQANDVAAAHPEQFERMKRRMIELHREVVAEGVEWDIPADYLSKAQRRVWNSP